ncbi:hypothetical protein EDB89DRAFT_640876 [Lactarius sanguifluus]|nr:hypothetical protein EDB89DRAFT_640876 [Lactarius sanguifluus]
MWAAKPFCLRRRALTGMTLSTQSVTSACAANPATTRRMRQVAHATGCRHQLGNHHARHCYYRKSSPELTYEHGQITMKNYEKNSIYDLYEPRTVQ